MNKWILLLLLPAIANATPISDAVAQNSAATDAISSATTSLSRDISDLIKKYVMTNAGTCALLVVGASSTNSVPIYFVPGPLPVSGINADIVSASPLITGIAAGPEAITDGKSISSTSITNGKKFILVGFNQTAIGAGNIAIVSLDTSQTPTGSHPITLSNFAATSPSGSVVPLCVTSGVITK